MADDKPGDRAFGTVEPTAPVTRADFERAVRFLNMSDLDLRDTLLRLAAQVVALTDELTRRIDHVEPQPAEPNTPAQPPTGTVEESVAVAVPHTLRQIRAADVREQISRVWLELDLNDKYEVEGADIPCAELMHLCKARCCKMAFPLSSRDLDEGIIRWDYGQPYMIRQRASDGYCVHNVPETLGCSVHAHRPTVCRKYDCRDDTRVWIDYDQRIPAPLDAPDPGQQPFDLMDRVARRAQAVVAEINAVGNVYPDNDVRPGPPPSDATHGYRRRG